jgi:hypothetical protein
MNATNKSDDVAEYGGIKALQLAFRFISSPLEEQVTGGGVGARVKRNQRFSQIYCGTDKGLFGYDFWDHGVYLGFAEHTDPLKVAQSLHTWIEDKATISQMRTLFPFVCFEAKADAFEKDIEVEWQWDRLEESMKSGDHKVALLPLVVAARKRNELKVLFPFTSLIRLCFSRCTGFPYSGDCPHAAPAEDGLFLVFDASEQIVGKGNVETAVQTLIDHLPPNCGPARKGTAEDL